MEKSQGGAGRGGHGGRLKSKGEKTSEATAPEEGEQDRKSRAFCEE